MCHNGSFSRLQLKTQFSYINNSNHLKLRKQVSKVKEMVSLLEAIRTAPTNLLQLNYFFSLCSGSIPPYASTLKGDQEWNKGQGMPEECTHNIEATFKYENIICMNLKKFGHNTSELSDS